MTENRIAFKWPTAEAVPNAADGLESVKKTHQVAGVGTGHTGRLLPA
jgi:hypothetical protein